MEKDDRRWQSMCKNPLTNGGDALLGEAECYSPFGMYDLNIPVDKEMECGGSEMSYGNCKDLDVSTMFS